MPKSKPKIRRYSVLPARAVQDDQLHITTLRVLAALCLHTNAYGICWPSQITLGRHISRGPRTVSRHMTRLINAGYVRKLQPRKYPMPVQQKSRWRTNRYQVLFDGPQSELPSREQFYAPRPKIADDTAETGVVPEEDARTKGFREIEASANILAHTFTHAVERATGSLRIASQQIKDAQQLAERGCTPEDVRDAVLKAAETGASTASLGVVAKAAGLL